MLPTAPSEEEQRQSSVAYRVPVPEDAYESQERLLDHHDPHFNSFHKNVYARALMNAACLLSAAPPWPPSMFSYSNTLWPIWDIFATIFRAWPGCTRSSR